MNLKVRTHSLTAIALASFAVSCTAWSATLLVPEDHLIHEAVQLAASGDTISVAAGVNIASDSLEIKVDNLTIEGRTGVAGEVIIQPAAAGIFLLNGWRRSRTTIRDLTLRNSSTIFGGVLFMVEVSDFEMHNCVVSDCTGTSGAVCLLIESHALIQDCFFFYIAGSRGPPVIADLPGGALAIMDVSGSRGSTRLIGCGFGRNSTGRGNGGAIATYETPFPYAKQRSKDLFVPEVSLSIQDCIFVENTAKNGVGGGIYLEAPGEALGVSIASTTIAYGTAERGGGLALDRSFGPVNLDLRDNVIEWNTATAGSGGGILIHEATPGTMATYPVEVGASVAIRSCTLERNMAAKNGGGVGIEAWNYRTEYIIEDNLFTGNLAPFGSGIHIGPSTSVLSTKGFTGPGDLILEGRVVGNRFVFNGIPAEITGPGEIILKDRAVGDRGVPEKMLLSVIGKVGGGIYLQDSTTEVRDNRFTLNAAEAGGGIALVNDASLITENFLGDPDSQIEDFPRDYRGEPTADGNIAAWGGGIAILFAPGLTKGVGPATGSPRITSNFFYRNGAETAGGCFFIMTHDDGMEAFIAGNVMIANWALKGMAVAFAADGVPGASIDDRVVFIHNTLLDHLPLIPSGSDTTILFLGESTEPLIANNIFANTGEIPSATGIYEDGDISPRVVANDFFNLEVTYIDNGSTPLGLTILNGQPQNSDNLVADPVFEASGPESFGFPNPHLASGSPVIDRAREVLSPASDLLTELPLDIDVLYRGAALAEPRILGGVADIGADEVSTPPTETPTPTSTETVAATTTPTNTLAPTETPTVVSTPTLSYDVAPDPLDGHIDARDLLEWFDRVKDSSPTRDLLFDFSRFWQSTAP